MRSFDDAADIAVDVTAQAAALVPTWLPILLSIIAVLVALFSAWTNWRASAPKLVVEIDLDRGIEQGLIRCKISNVGKNWVENVRITWKFDPTGYHAGPAEWSRDLLMPGEHFHAHLAHFSTSSSTQGREGATMLLEEFQTGVADPALGKRRIGVAKFKRQTSIPLVRVRQRVSLPLPSAKDFDYLNQEIELSA